METAGTPDSPGIAPVAAALHRPLLAMRRLWLCAWGLNLAYLLLGGAVAARLGVGPHRAQAMSLPGLTAALSGLGGLAAMASVPARAVLKRRILARARTLPQYLRAAFAAECAGLALCHAWAICALILRALGAGPSLQFLLTMAAGIAYFLHYPFPAGVVRDVLRLQQKHPDFLPESQP